MREDYTRPVGHAREPITERRRWVARIGLLALMILLGWLLYFRVLNPPEDNLGPTTPTESTLPGPL